MKQQRPLLQRSVRMFIVDDGRLLLVRKRLRKMWHTPGGGVDKKETAEQAVLRESAVEIGLRCKKATLLHTEVVATESCIEHIDCFTCQPKNNYRWDLDGDEIDFMGRFSLDETFRSSEVTDTTKLLLQRLPIINLFLPKR